MVGVTSPSDLPPSERAELERLRSECCRCAECGHVQAEPNWCHVCRHRVEMPDWASELVGELMAERKALAAAEDRLEEVRDLINGYWAIP